jgi:hypothetical protein
MCSGAACAPGHSRKTAATASAQETKNRGVLKGRCIIKSIDALEKEVDATKGCACRARRGARKFGDFDTYSPSEMSLLICCNGYAVAELLTNKSTNKSQSRLTNKSGKAPLITQDQRSAAAPGHAAIIEVF